MLPAYTASPSLLPHLTSVGFGARGPSAHHDFGSSFLFSRPPSLVNDKPIYPYISLAGACTLPTKLGTYGVLFLALVSQAFLLAAIYECRGLPSPPSGVIGNLSTTGVGSVSNRSLDLPFLLSHSALFSTDKGRLRESVAQCPGLSPREVGSDDRRLPFPSRG